MDQSRSRLHKRQALLCLGLLAWVGVSLAVLVTDEVKHIIPGGWCRGGK